MLSSTLRLNKWIDRRFDAWVERRIKKQRQHQLSQKNLFIFPTQRGFVFIAIMVAVWLLGTNYQNNLILALAFLMSALFVVAIFQTFRNLNKVSIQYLRYGECFAGEDMSVVFSIDNPGSQWCEALELTWNQQGALRTRVAVQGGSGLTELTVALPDTVRGRVAFPKMMLQSHFPLGIIRCWSLLNWDIDALVYPAPKSATLKQLGTIDDEGDGLHPVSGTEEFSGLKNYQAGDPLRRIAWKAYAAGRGLHVKEFAQSLSKELWLDFHGVEAHSTEERLSALCFWVQQFYLDNEYFGFRLPGFQLSPGRGELHRKECLRALALFPASR